MGWLLVLLCLALVHSGLGKECPLEGSRELGLLSIWLWSPDRGTLGDLGLGKEALPLCLRGTAQGLGVLHPSPAV